MQSVSLVEGLITLNLGTTQGKVTGVWTRTQGANLLGLVGVGAWSYLGYTGSPLLNIGSKFGVGSMSANLLNIDLLGLNLVESSLMNVRCVRDATWQEIHKKPGYKPDPVYEIKKK